MDPWVAERVCRFVERELELPEGAATPDGAIGDLPGVESIKLLRAVMRIENHFGVELEDEAIFEVRRVAELIALVEDARGAPARFAAEEIRAR